MCGIAGVIHNDLTPVNLVTLRRMAGTIAHRGPDSEGVWADHGIGLAHRRLSIIDLAGGAQPMGNEDGSVQVVFNGEIYNYRELREDLISRGHCFRTSSDTEVLVHLYEEVGEYLVERLRGMFASALWDVRRRRLLLARDRIGLKPLYYYRDSNTLVFGSEIKAILAYPGTARDISVEAVEHYLTYGVVTGEQSIFQNIWKPSAWALPIDWSWRPASRAPADWQLEFRPDDSRSVLEWLEVLRAKIQETVSLHTIADVPVGAFLSGGLDSSAIVATLNETGTQPVSTFSIGFSEEAFSELPYARQVAQQFSTPHFKQIVTPRAADSLSDLIRYYDEPFADPSAIPTMAVCRLARQTVKVALSGDGGDEAFGGYLRYAHDLREHVSREWIPTWIQRLLFRRLAHIWPKTDWPPRSLRAKTVLTNMSLDAAAAYANTISICRPEMRRRLLRGDVQRSLHGYRPEQLIINAYRGCRDDPLRGMLAADTSVLLPDDFLTKVDRASMAVGLEVRPPFVDHELLELAAQIPSQLKVRRGDTKWILKQVFHDRLPAKVVRREKHGFDVPVNDWLRGPLREKFEATALNRQGPLADFFQLKYIEQLYRSHLRRTGRHGPLLWSLLVLGCWMEEYLGAAHQQVSENTLRDDRMSLAAIRRFQEF